MLCTVQKEFETVGGRKLPRGTRVDSTQFRLGRQLIDQRYLAPLPALQEVATPDPEMPELKTGKKKNA